MTSQEARRRSSWARAIGSRFDVELPYGLRIDARGLPGLFAPGAFDRVYGPGVTAFFMTDEVEPRVTVIALMNARSVRATITHVLGASDREPASAPLDELEAGAAHFTAAMILRETMGDALRLGVVLTERDSIRQALGREVWDHLGVELTFGDQRHSIDLLRRGRIDAPSAPSPRDLTRRVALPLSLSMGFTSLSLAELSSLEPGDALLLERAAADGEVYLLVPGTPFARRGSIVRRSVIVGESVDLPSLHPQEKMNHEDITRPLNDARIELSAELARTSMRVGEIERLAVGEVFQLGVDVGESIALRAGDVIVARGELVDVDGRLGVLIRSLGA
jgi:type III secretion system YscQ/HrcQ family protein